MIEPTQETLYQMLDSVRLLASIRRRFNRHACDFYHATEAEQVEEFNTRILPLWEQAGRPEMFKPGWLEFQMAVFSGD